MFIISGQMFIISGNGQLNDLQISEFLFNNTNLNVKFTKIVQD